MKMFLLGVATALVPSLIVLATLVVPLLWRKDPFGERL
jgi:hypothetical protein